MIEFYGDLADKAVSSLSFKYGFTDPDSGHHPDSCEGPFVDS